MLLRKARYSQPSNALIPNMWDIIALLLVISLIAAFAWAAEQMTLPFHLGQKINISLSVSNLPSYALQTTLRMFIALGCSFLFAFVVATLAAKNKKAGKIIIPLIDILQSVPILGYLSVTITGFIVLFPNSMFGPACAAIFAVFTSQVWNMTLSFYQSLITVPEELIETTRVYQLSSWKRFWRLEVPFAIPGLLWNAMMSMSGGWFFIVAAEAITVGNQRITLPGIGSYIALAIEQKNVTAIISAIIAMLVVIALYDQLFFRPLVAWSQKFKLTDMPDEEASSWILTLLQRTKALQYFGNLLDMLANGIINCRLKSKSSTKPRIHQDKTISEKSNMIINLIWYGILLTLIIISCVFIYRFIFSTLPLSDAWHVIVLGFYTALRVFALIAICLVIWVPIGVWIGLKPKVAQFVQPLAQFIASFPANLFFPLAFLLIVGFNLNFEIWCAPLMVLGTQWYILFNVIAGASNIPKELKLAAKNMQLKGLLKWRRFLLPAIFPYIITGAITAAGGAWNASIVAEIIQWGHKTLVAQGLGSYIAIKTIDGHFARIALGVVIMCLWVVLINMVVWRPLYKHAEVRYKLS